MKRIIALTLPILLAAPSCLAENKIDPKSREDKINYSVGYQIGGDFKNQDIPLKVEAMIKGMEDGAAAEAPLIGQEEMRKTLIDLKKKIMEAQLARSKQDLAKQQEQGGAFLAANAKKKGVVVLPSGLQYKVLQEGTGSQPTLQDKVTVHYRGTRLDGSEFSNTWKAGQPDAIELTKGIPAWQEALPMMKEGAKWELYVPARLAFGEHGPLKGQALIYQVELIKVQRDAAEGATAR